MAKTVTKVRCEGWRRRGGIFTFGPVKWEQCENDAVIRLKVKQDGKTEEQPACMICWKEGVERKVEILEVTPL